MLVVGGSYSAEDAALQCYKYGTKHVTWTYRKLRAKYNFNNFPKNIETITGLSHFDENHAYFENG